MHSKISKYQRWPQQMELSVIEDRRVISLENHQNIKLTQLLDYHYYLIINFIYVWLLFGKAGLYLVNPITLYSLRPNKSESMTQKIFLKNTYSTMWVLSLSINFVNGFKLTVS